MVELEALSQRPIVHHSYSWNAYNVLSPLSPHPALHEDSHPFGYGSSSHAVSISTTLDRDRTLSPSPTTVRPEPPSTESEALPMFTVSTILPNFLFLGPELTEPSHVEELKNLGVKEDYESRSGVERG